jgi:hypothetical protein
MFEESTTPDLVELARRFLEAADRRELDSISSFYAPDAVLDAIRMGASFEVSQRSAASLRTSSALTRSSRSSPKTFSTSATE